MLLPNLAFPYQKYFDPHLISVLMQTALKRCDGCNGLKFTLAIPLKLLCLSLFLNTAVAETLPYHADMQHVRTASCPRHCACTESLSGWTDLWQIGGQTPGIDPFDWIPCWTSGCVFSKAKAAFPGYLERHLISSSMYCSHMQDLKCFGGFVCVLVIFIIQKGVAKWMVEYIFIT